MAVSYRLIGGRELDETLIAAWRSVQSATEMFRSPYFCPEFTQAVASVREDVRIVVIENGGRPVGFFPHQRGWFGFGRPVGGALSDYHGVIAHPLCEWDMTELMGAAKLSAWHFDHLVGDVSRFHPYIRATEPSPQIDLREGFERYAKGREYIRRTEGKARKLVREVGEIRFSLHDPSDAVVNQLIRWKRDQYSRAGLPNAFAVRWTGRLLDKIMHAQTPEFAGVCSVLRVNNRVVAVHLGMKSSTVLHYWFPAYDPDLAKYSTGIILLLRMAESVVDDGVEVIDLGKGEAQYKERLMSGAVNLSAGMVELPSVLSSILKAKRSAEVCAARGGPAAIAKLPLGVIRRIVRRRRYR